MGNLPLRQVLFDWYSRGRIGNLEDPALAFWMGHVPTSRPFPGCWDELLDWTEEASEIFQTYLIRHSNRETNMTTIVSLDAVEDEMETIQFIPLVSVDQTSTLHDLPSMDHFDPKAKFYADHVIISIRNKQGDVIGVLNIGTFVQLYTLLSRYADLLKVLHSKTHKKKDGHNSNNNQTVEKDKIDNDKKALTKTKEECCLICFDEEDKDMVVLSPCSHVMCTACYKKWVTRRYQCPFCRHDFSRQSVQNFNGRGTWQVLEWQWGELEDDVNRLHDKLTKIWMTIQEHPPFAFSSVELLQQYVSMGRILPAFHEEEEDLLVAE